MQLDIDLRNKLLPFCSSVEQGKISQDEPSPRICLTLRQSNEAIDFSGNGGIVESYYDVECAALDIDVVTELASTVKHALNGFRGAMEQSFVLGCFVEDQSEQYESKLLGEDIGWHTVALDTLVISKGNNYD